MENLSSVPSAKPVAPAAMDKTRRFIEVLEARMKESKEGLPVMSATSRKMEFNTDQATKLLEWVARFRNAKGLTQAAFARLCGINATSLSSLINGNYSGDADDQLTRIQQFLTREADRDEMPRLGRFAETSVANQVLACCKQNHTYGTLGLVVGPSGKGKTMAFREYAMRNAGVCRISAADWIKTPRQLAIAMLRMTAKNTTPHNFEDICAALIESLQGESRLIIVDQAHQLSEHCQEFLQNIYDYVNDGEARMGMVLGGTFRLATSIIADKQQYLYEQLQSRINAGYTVQLRKPFSMTDIKLVFDKDNLQYTLSEDALTFLLRKANDRGGLRQAVGYVIKAQENSIKKRLDKGTIITAENLESMSAMMLAA
jgi:DNA transposition AAA+ family ATPase